MAETMNIRAQRRRPTGFSEPEYYTSDVVIIGFVHGIYVDTSGHRDGKLQETLAVYVEGERLLSAPIWQFRLASGALSEGGE